MVQLPRYLLIRKILRDISLPVISIISIYFGGSWSIARIEGWSLEEGLYFMLATLTTIGYGDYTPTHVLSRRITMIVIILGIGVISLSINAIGNRIIRHSLNHDFRYEEAIKTLSQHIIIAGYSDIGKRVATYLRSWGLTLVVVDTELSNVQAARDDDLVAIQSDIANPRELRKLNLEYATGIILAIEDPNITLISAKAALVLNPDLWIISEAEVGMSRSMYKRAGISHAIDRFTETRSKIRGILWGLEIQNYEFFMPDSTAFFSIPNFHLLKEEELTALGFQILGLIDNNEFFPYQDNELLFDYSDYLLVAGPADQTSELANALRTHIPEDKDGVKRVMLVGYGKYAKSILHAATRNADEVYIIEDDEDLRKEAKKAGRADVDVRTRASKSLLEIMDIIILTSRAAGQMIALTLRAKELNDDVKIYARAAIAEHIDIFESAGAEYVFSPEVDCASNLSSKAIEFEFDAQSVPFKNGQLVFHRGSVKIRQTSRRFVLASYQDSDGPTTYFDRLQPGPTSFNLEFVQFKQ